MFKRFGRMMMRTQPEPVRAAVRNLLNEVKMARAVKRSARQFDALRDRTGLKVHLGCGGELKSGWVNIDLNVTGLVPPIPSHMSPDTVFILYDLRSGKVPLADGSCDLVYSSHFFEHLEYRHGFHVMHDCHRILRPGGVFRAGLPKFKEAFRAYVDGNPEHFDSYNLFDVLPDIEPETVSLVDHLNYGVYQGGEHKCIYDEEKISRVLRRIGFRSVSITDYQEGLDPANEIRRRYTFYVEATK